MGETKTYHAVHDRDGNIKSIFSTTSNVGAQEMMAPARGCSVSEVNPQQLTAAGDDVIKLREAMKRHRVDTSGVSSLIRKATNQK